MSFHNEVRNSVLTVVLKEQAELPELQTMESEKLIEFAAPISHYYTLIPPATNQTLEGYMQTKSA